MTRFLPWLGVLALLGFVACQRRKPTAPATTSKLYSAMLQRLLKESVPFVSVAELRRQPAPVLLDTRSAREFRISHLQGARWVDYDSFAPTLVQDIPKNTPIVVYCSVGLRSERIGTKLKEAGYTNVRNLYGGLFEWINEGQPVVTAAGQPTDSVHAYSPAWGVWLQRGQKVYE